MTIFESIILGLVQGLTEFLPIPSSGHIEIGKILMNINLNIRIKIIMENMIKMSMCIVEELDIN